jgi:NADH dehydrogenase
VSTEHRPRIVIIGGGFAGAYCAQALEKRLRPEAAEIVVINRENYFIFYPLLVEMGTGSVEPRHVVVSIRSFLRHARFVMGSVVGLDTQGKRVLWREPGGKQDNAEAYDHLVIALGSVTLLPPVEGLREHGWQMKSTTDAVALRDRVIQMLEMADSSPEERRRRELLGFVVVGANFTGAEVAGELEAFLTAALKRYRRIRREEIRITLIDRADRILAALEPDLSEYARKTMTRRGIDIRLGETVTRIDATSATLGNGEVIPAATVVWAAGIAPAPVIKRMGLPLDERGYIVCERDLRVRGFQEIWGIGDCAVNTDATGKAYPATAQHAVREGAWAAANIARVLRGEPALPCDLVSQGSLAALGCRTGVASVMGVKLSGFWAWWLWRTVYLLKMPGLVRKLRLAIDWTLELLFRREFVQLGVHRAERRRDHEPEGV